jgi:hypothetical protein
LIEDRGFTVFELAPGKRIPYSDVLLEEYCKKDREKLLNE